MRVTKLTHGEPIDPRPIAPAERHGAANPRLAIEIGCAAQHELGGEQLFQAATVARVHSAGNGLFAFANL